MAVLSDKQFFVLGGAALLIGVAAAWYLRKGFLDGSLNPASDKNVVYQGVNQAVGEERLAGWADYFFAGVDLLNPLNESDAYAKQVYGIGGG